jgi:DNA-binding Lrp family transcriptional regulator
MTKKGHGTSWRNTLPIHPAAELFPLMSADDLSDTAKDIKANGLTLPIALWQADPDAEFQLLDGRNRLNALEIATGGPVSVKPPTIKMADGSPVPNGGRVDVEILDGRKVDPYAYVISANIRRRHLSIGDKDRLIVQLLKADPTKSNRQVAKLVDASHPHVAKVREKAEKTGDVETVTTSVDTKGRKQPSRKVGKKSSGKAGNKTGKTEKSSEKTGKKPSDKAGKKPSDKTGNTPKPSGEVVGADSTGEAALRERIRKIENEKRQLETQNLGLKSEVEEAKARPALDADVRSFLDVLIARVSKMNGEEERKGLFRALYETLRGREELLASEAVP